jgi:cobalt/nickel transport system permease protein
LTAEGFLARNIAVFTSALESIVVNEELSRARGALQSIDPRVKLSTFLLFAVVASLARSIWVLAALFVLVVACALLGKIPLQFFIKRVLLFLPFSAIIALPALFITPGEPLLHLGTRVVMTGQGARTAGFLLLRVVDSASLGLLLVLSTPWNSILAALRWFRMPSVVVEILGMTYRYIFVLIHTANSAFLSRRSRSLGTLSAAENRRWLARALASIMGKTQHMSEQVYLAMLARGYHGEFYSLNRLKFGRLDCLWLGSALAVAFGLLWTNYR